MTAKQGIRFTRFNLKQLSKSRLFHNPHTVTMLDGARQFKPQMLEDFYAYYHQSSPTHSTINIVSTLLLLASLLEIFRGLNASLNGKATLFYDMTYF